MAETQELIRLAVFGRPVKNSLSPRIHSAFAGQFGLPIDYRAIEATPENFPKRVAKLAQDGGRGCNVTVPFKHEAWRLADRCSPEAERAQAANTLRFDADGFFATNTDGFGLVNDLEKVIGLELRGLEVCLLGAGGAARGVLGSLLGQQPKSVTIANRSLDRALALAERYSDLGDVQGASLDAAASRGPFDLVINATAMGHRGEAPGLDGNWFGSAALCYDMNYGHAADPLASHCSKLGVRYSDGLGMLVAQAALSFELWTGKRPDTLPVLESLRAAARE
jgi:shikimate dehydrogenase